jgi:hypothetical protein
VSYRQNDGARETANLYAWIAPDLDGIEGVIVAPTELGLLPLAFADEQRAREWRAVAQRAASWRGGAARLVRFARADVLDEVAPA